MKIISRSSKFRVIRQHSRDGCQKKKSENKRKLYSAETFTTTRFIKFLKLFDLYRNNFISILNEYFIFRFLKRREKGGKSCQRRKKKKILVQWREREKKKQTHKHNTL